MNRNIIKKFIDNCHFCQILTPLLCYSDAICKHFDITTKQNCSLVCLFLNHYKTFVICNIDYCAKMANSVSNNSEIIDLI